MAHYELGNAQRQGEREEQQDSAGCSDPTADAVGHAGVLGVLCDGVGGLNYGATAARLSVRTFLAAYGRKTPVEAIPDALRRSLAETNEAVLEFAREKKCEQGGTAATLVAAVLKNHELFWISAGDSRAYLVRSRNLFRLNVDHTYHEDRRPLAAVAGNVGAPDPTIDPDAVSSVMGLPGTPKADWNRRPFRLVGGDWVLLASDGLYKSLDEAAIPELMKVGAQESCECLVQAVEAKHLKGQDNVTVLAMAIRGNDQGDAEAPGGGWMTFTKRTRTKG